MKKVLLLFGILLTVYTVSFFYLKLTIPKFSLKSITSESLGKERSLPFFELMGPIPTNSDDFYLPRLEYKKGPPQRYLESLSIVFAKSPLAPKERITYYGRKTKENSFSLWLFPNSDYGQFLKTALVYSQSGVLPDYGKNSILLEPFLKMALLLEARNKLTQVNTVGIMDQAGAPSFLFSYENGKKIRALFIRRNSIYEVNYYADKSFQVLMPEKLFSRSFLVEKRADALEYLAKQLNAVHFNTKSVKNLSLKNAAWPMALLAANMSLDPSSIDAFFHFAGISALLYKSNSTDQLDIESTDILRNNVIAADLFGKDVAPNSTQSAEMSQISRTLTSKFSP